MNEIEKLKAKKERLIKKNKQENEIQELKRDIRKEKYSKIYKVASLIGTTSLSASQKATAYASKKMEQLKKENKKQSKKVKIKPQKDLLKDLFGEY